MSEQRLPYGVYLIEQFVEERYPQDAGGLGVALGDAMDKDSGLYYRVRWEAYEKHFDHVITEICIKTVYKELETDVFKLPPYQVTTSKEFKAMVVRLSFTYADRPDFNFQLSIDHWNLYEKYPFEHLAQNIHRHFKSEKDDMIYGNLWKQLSHDAKELFLYEFGVNLKSPLFTPQSAVEEIKDAELMLGAFNPTDKGHELTRWLHKVGQVS